MHKIAIFIIQIIVVYLISNKIRDKRTHESVNHLKRVEMCSFYVYFGWLIKMGICSLTSN